MRVKNMSMLEVLLLASLLVIVAAGAIVAILHPAFRDPAFFLLPVTIFGLWVLKLLVLHKRRKLSSVPFDEKAWFRKQSRKLIILAAMILAWMLTMGLVRHHMGLPIYGHEYILLFACLALASFNLVLPRLRR
jgi:hypothetical protein